MERKLQQKSSIFGVAINTIRANSTYSIRAGVQVICDLGASKAHRHNAERVIETIASTSRDECKFRLQSEGERVIVC